MNGIFALYYTGGEGSGEALLVIKEGIVCGADVAGGLMDGTIEQKPEGHFQIDITHVVPVGAWLVTGPAAEDEPITQKISGSLPSNFADGHTVRIETQFGPVNAVFQRIRDVI